MTVKPSRRARPSRRQIAILLCAIGISPALGFASRTPDQDGSELITRFLSRHDQPLVQYRALRHLRARCDNNHSEAWMDVWTELDQSGFRYEIVGEGGSDFIRGHVLRKALRMEQQQVENGEAARMGLTAENYQFTEGSVTEDEAGTEYRVAIRPRRKHVLLVEGMAVLTADGTDLLRVEGRLSKNPSFWTSRVDIVRRYDRIGGVRVPVALESVAQVRLAGRAWLDVTYDYASINRRPVGSVPASR